MRYVPHIIEAWYDKTPGWARSTMSTLYGALKARKESSTQFEHSLAELRESQWWPKSRIEELQSDRIKKLIMHAAVHVPYYRDLFATHGINATQIQTEGDLKIIPSLSKEKVRTHLKDLVADNVRSSALLRETTSGTTALPMSVWVDQQTYRYYMAAQWLHHSWAGYTHKEWIGILAGYKVLSTSQVRPPFWITNYAGKQVHFSTYHLNPEWTIHYVRKLRDSGIRFLLGYPSAIGLLAQQMLMINETLSIEAVFLSSEPVYEWQEKAIQSAFGARIFSYYGHAERAISAISCGESTFPGSLHINEEITAVEFVRDPFSEDKVLVVGTGLTNYAMPLIRYEIHDITQSVKGFCSCGRKHKLMGPVETRSGDYVVTPSGSRLSPRLLSRAISQTKGISSFQFVQHDIRSITVKIVPMSTFTVADEEYIRKQVIECVGPGMEIEIHPVADIQRTRSGKLRVVVSELSTGELSLDAEEVQKPILGGSV